MFTLSKSKESNFNMTFGGENEILIEDLIHSLDGFSNLLNIVTSTLEPEAKVELKFKKSSAGSFDVEFILFLTGNFISLVNSLEEPSKVIKLLIEFLDFKKFLNGEPPRSIKIEENGLFVENMEGGVINFSPIVIKISDNPLTDTYLKKMFTTSRESLELSTNEGYSFKAEKSEYDKLVKEVESQVQATEEREISSRVRLQIKKPDFLGSSMWEFIYKDKTVKAIIKDIHFLESLQRGSVSINSHTFLEVELKSISEIDEIGTVLSTKHEIIQVYNLITENVLEQESFLDE